MKRGGGVANRMNGRTDADVGIGDGASVERDSVIDSGLNQRKRRRIHMRTGIKIASIVVASTALAAFAFGFVAIFGLLAFE